MSNDLTQSVKANFFLDEWDKLGCPICQSLFHAEEACPQAPAKSGNSKFKFKSRKEMGLEPGALPFKFRIEIDPDMDDEAEVTRKRALLRLNSTKVYNLMGLSVKAQEAHKASLQWLVRMADEMDIEDPTLQEQRKELLPLIRTMQDAANKLAEIRNIRIRQAEEMEEVTTKARSTSRRARIRIKNRNEEKQKESREEFFVMRLPDSIVDVPLYHGQNPMELLQDAATAIMLKEKTRMETTDED